MNRLENHDECLAKVRKSIDDTAAAGFPNVICFSGNRAGMDDQEGLKNCVIGLKKIAGYAEKKKVTVCLDSSTRSTTRTTWPTRPSGASRRSSSVGSPRVKVLYDIYHAAMMKEDVLADIQKHADCWGHYHTGGVPGRHEIDKTQTLDYAKIMRAIAETRLHRLRGPGVRSQAARRPEEPRTGRGDLRRVTSTGKRSGAGKRQGDGGGFRRNVFPFGEIHW